MEVFHNSQIGNNMRMSECHPNKLYYAKGLCKTCYQRKLLKETRGKKTTWSLSKSKEKFKNDHRVGYIYTISNLTNGRTYVGKSFYPKFRWTDHKSHLNRNRHENGRLQKDWIVFGKDSFKFNVILKCDAFNLTFYEYKIITKLKPFYNILISSYTNRPKSLCCVCHRFPVYFPKAPICKKCFKAFIGDGKIKFKDYPDWLKYMIYCWRASSKAKISKEIPLSWLKKGTHMEEILYNYPRDTDIRRQLDGEDREFLEHYK
jgi:hypothetical protein